MSVAPRDHRGHGEGVLESQNGLQGTFTGLLVQAPCSEQEHLQGIFKALLRAPSNLTMNVPRDGASTISLGNLCQGFTTLIIKNVFLTSSLNLPSFSLKPSPLVPSQLALLKSLSPSFPQAPFQHWKAAISSPWSLLSKLSSPYLTTDEERMTSWLLSSHGHHRCVRRWPDTLSLRVTTSPATLLVNRQSKAPSRRE